uniref:Protein arginine N-methyltransferase n=1 Tax=Strigamia maritima TaxID=126957 RepID=T1JI27_STRMM
MAKRRLICGLDFNSVTDINNVLSNTTLSGFDYVACPIVHPRFRREFEDGKPKNRSCAFTRSDMLLTSQDWGSLIVGKVSPYLQLDSEVESVRKNSEEALEQELLYASHLGLPAVLLQVWSGQCVNLARHVHNRIASSSNQANYQIWVKIPMQSTQEASHVWLKDGKNQLEVEGDPWHWWNTFRSVCNFEKKVGLALEITTDLPDDSAVTRWKGEPVHCIIIPTNIFLTNKKGYPVLSRAHQNILRHFFTMNVQMLITGINHHSHIKLYHQYVEYLWQNIPADDSLTAFAKGYEDYLQCPLQPLMDNLETQTYEIFEKDPIKYSEYQKAIYQAIMDKISEEEKETKEIVLMVVGAGRGPLVRSALSTAQKAGRKVKIYAIEKNPNAIVTLLSQKDEMWGDAVTVISSDMREWDTDEKADILVSELLGSFGDNELSPECLDGAQKFLKDDGINIPCTYTSYLSPLQSSKLYNEVRLAKEKDKHPLVPFETPYVVHLHNILELAEPQSLFRFDHPNKSPVKDNRRYKNLKFKITQDAVLHGFAGYFEAQLYKDVTLSIHPKTHSPGMFSWFPIMFPIKDPVPLTKGCEVDVHFWRCANKRSVWYEWLISKPHILPVHNPNGRSYTIGL